MTLINLLPPEIAEKRRKRQQLVLVSALFCVYSMVLAGIWCYFAMQKRILTAEVKELDTKIAELAPIIAEVQQIEAGNNEIKRRVGVINGLIKGRFRWVTVMDELSKAMTEDVWLGGFSPGAEKSISISCFAFSNYAVANFMVGLMKNPFFANIEISSVSGEDIKNFTLTMNYFYGD
ncbi:PilN domain-containing protein [bacterium]|nr:PilN domain-containing protein [bacterium]MBU1600010.1 PilN domain-containing protein [bacterium]